MENNGSAHEKLLDVAGACESRFLRAYQMQLNSDIKYVQVDELMREEYIRLKSRSFSHDLFISRPVVGDTSNPFSFTVIKANTDPNSFENSVPVVLLKGDPNHFYKMENELITGRLDELENSVLKTQINHARVIPLNQ